MANTNAVKKFNARLSQTLDNRWMLGWYTAEATAEASAQQPRYHNEYYTTRQQALHVARARGWTLVTTIDGLDQLLH